MKEKNAPLFGIDCDSGIYTKTLPHIQYVPTKREKPSVESCFNTEKYRKLCKKINNSNIPEVERNFLLLAATRHIVFNYENVAEYYCHADKETQELMEESGLVIIDFEDAIENGYVELTAEIKALYDEAIAEKEKE